MSYLIKLSKTKKLCGLLIGLTAAAGLAAAQSPPAPPPPPRPGETMTLKFHDGKERSVKVLKSERLPDGSILSEVQDVRTGETFKLLDPPQTGATGFPTPSQGGSRAKGGNLKSKSGGAPPAPPVATPPASDRNRPLLKLFRFGKDESPEVNRPAESRPGLFQRLFGPKRKEEPALPPLPPPSASSGQPARPGRPGDLPVGEFRTPPGGLAVPQQMPPQRHTAVPAPTAEPPRALPRGVNPTPARPVIPPVPPATEPPPVAIPSSPDPLSPPSVPPTAPAVPPIPVPTPPDLPAIPLPPAGIAPAGAILNTRMAAVPSPIDRDMAPYVQNLRAAAPSARVLAVRALAEGRHGSTDQVKAILWTVCRTDPAPLVRACAIDALAKLGYRDPAFLAYLEETCRSADAELRQAARLALQRLNGE